jgi:hypothetical protein
LSSTRPSFSLPPRKRAGFKNFDKPAESKHHVVSRGNLARQRIEQHAYIPYTHGWRSVYDDLATAIVQTDGSPSNRRQSIKNLHSDLARRPQGRFAFRQRATFNPQTLTRTNQFH